MNIIEKAVRVYKSVLYGSARKPAIAVLLLTKGTRINCPLSYTGKNRADKAKVLSIKTLSILKGSIAARSGCNCSMCTAIRKKNNSFKPKAIKSAYSAHDESFKYRVGKTVMPTNYLFSESPDECAAGIHFFKNRVDAEQYR